MVIGWLSAVEFVFLVEVVVRSDCSGIVGCELGFDSVCSGNSGLEQWNYEK